MSRFLNELFKRTNSRTWFGLGVCNDFGINQSCCVHYTVRSHFAWKISLYDFQFHIQVCCLRQRRNHDWMCIVMCGRGWVTLLPGLKRQWLEELRGWKKKLTRGSSSTLQESGKSSNSSRCVIAAVKAEGPVIYASRWSAMDASGM